jgi:hypothetical protein
MGNDLDVCSQDDELDAIYSNHFGSKSDSSLVAFKKLLSNFSESICNPQKKNYSTQDLQIDAKGLSLINRYKINEIKRNLHGTILHTIIWKSINQTASTPLVIIYIHTNTGCALNALEVIPLAETLNGSIISFDLPGCGKSEGKLNGNIEILIQDYIDFAKSMIGNDARIIIWARAMGTCPLIEFTAKNSYSAGCPVKAIVLDSPFVSMEQMVKDSIERFQNEGYYAPQTALLIAFKIVSKLFASRFGVNPYDVSPIKVVENCCIPCFVLSAMEDDYIPIYHGEEIACRWNGPVTFKAFSGKHAGYRPEELVMNTVSFIASYCN